MHASGRLATGMAADYAGRSHRPRVRMDVVIYHNPRCSKSRAALALLRERGIEPRIVHYLETPPSQAQTARWLSALGRQPRDLMRRSEPAYRELGLADASHTDAALVAAMATHPVLIERPVVEAGGRVALGRPPEAILDIL
jgi:arsenate reductase